MSKINLKICLKYFNLALFFVLSLIIVILSVYSMTNIVDLYANQPEEPHIQTIVLPYPNTMSEVYQGNSNVANELPSKIFTIVLYLKYDEPLVEESQVQVTGYGIQYQNDQKLIDPGFTDFEGINYPSCAQVVFQSAISKTKNNAMVSGGSLPVYLFNSDEQVPILFEINQSSAFLNFLGAPNIYSEIVSWDTEGDYSPIVVIRLVNGTRLIIPYNDHKIRVNPYEVARQNNYTKINTWLAIVLFFFTIVTTAPILHGLGKKVYEDFFNHSKRGQ